MTERTVYEGQVGPIRARITAAGGALIMFDAKVRNEIIRRALLEGGKFWMRAFLPMRFSQYAFRIGYHVSRKWADRKTRDLGVAVPYVGFTPPGGGPAAPGWTQKNGEKMITAALNGANVKATAAAERASLTFRIPYGHAVRPETSASFRALPTWEVDRIAEVTGAALEAEIGGQFMSGVGVRAVGVPGAARPVSARRARAAAAVAEHEAIRSRILGLGTPRKVGGHTQRRVA